MRDIEPQVPLHSLDPSDTDPAYWDRFHAVVLASAQPRLLGRRRSPLAIENQVMLWRRAILTAATAAAGAALLLLGSVGGADVPEALAGLEEVMDATLDGGEPLPGFLHSEEAVDRDVVLFAVEQF